MAIQDVLIVGSTIAVSFSNALLASAPDPISGGSGWVGAGLLGMVLGWLLLKHLPDKDRQLREILESKYAHIKEVIDKYDAREEKIYDGFKTTLEQLKGTIGELSTSIRQSMGSN